METGARTTGEIGVAEVRLLPGSRLVPRRVNGVPSYEPDDERFVQGASPTLGQGGAIGTRVLGYATVEEGDGERAHAELRRQAAEIASECERRSLCLITVVRERERQHQRPLERPGLVYAFEKVAAGEASGIVVAELSRITHSVPELGRVLEWLARRDARFVATEIGLDTGEEAGRLAVRTIIDVSSWERQRLAERTRNGMRAARRKGPASVADHPELRERIVRMRAARMTLQAIADQLNADGIPTVRGGAKWRPSSVQAAAGYRRPPAGYTLDQSVGNLRNSDAELQASRNERRTTGAAI